MKQKPLLLSCTKEGVRSEALKPREANVMLAAARISMHTEAARTSERRRIRSTSKLHEDEDNEGRRERRAAAYVPISQEARYLRCSLVRLSTFIPTVCSFNSATCLSISCGTL